MSLTDRFANDAMSVRHSDHTVQELQDNMITLADITRMRVYLPKFPYTAINYDEADNYRKSGVDPHSERIQELGKGIANSGLQQPIGLYAANLGRDELHNMANDPKNSTDEFWNTPIHTIFGNRRYLAITNHTDITHEAAYIYPKEADKWRKTIAFIENMDREDVPLIEEAVGLYNEVTNRFGGVVSRFSEFSGKSNDALSRLFKIGEAAKTDGMFAELVKSEKTNDMIALDHLARSILSESSTHRTNKIESVIKAIIDHNGKVEALRKKAKQVRDYASGKANTLPDVESKSSNEGTTQPKDTNTKEPKSLSANDINRFIRRLEGLNTVDDVTRDALVSLQQALTAKV